LVGGNVSPPTTRPSGAFCPERCNTAAFSSRPNRGRLAVPRRSRIIDKNGIDAVLADLRARGEI